MLHTEKDVPKAQFRLALIGKPLMRKSSIAAHFPKPGFLDVDQNISRIMQHYPTVAVRWAQPQLDDQGKRVAANAVWPRARSLINELINSPDVGTIVIDSMSALQEHIIDWILDQPVTGKMRPLVISGIKVLNQEQYRPFQDQVLTLISDVASAGKPAIFIFHEQEVRNEAGNLELIQPLLTSSLRHSVARVFTDVWRVSHKMCAVDAKHPQGVSYHVQTAPLPLMPSLGTSGALPVQFEFDWAVIEKGLPWLKSL